MNVLFINGKRNGYDTNQCGKTLTVRELIEELECFEDDMLVFLRNDNGYTYGSVTKQDIYDKEAMDDEWCLSSY